MFTLLFPSGMQVPCTLAGATRVLNGTPAPWRHTVKFGRIVLATDTAGPTIIGPAMATDWPALNAQLHAAGLTRHVA